MAESEHDNGIPGLAALLCARGVSFDHLAESLPDLFSVFDADGRLLYWNRQVGTSTGLDDDAIAGMHPVDFFCGDDRERVQTAIETAIADGASRIEADLLARDGSVHPHLFVARALATDASPLVAGFGIDISERKRTEERLQENQRFLETLMANLPGAVYRCDNDDPDWSLHFISGGCQQLTGHTPDELVRAGSPTLGELIHPDDRADVWQAVQEAVSHGMPFRVQYRLWHREAGYRWVWEQGQTLDDDPAHRTLEGFITDITAAKQAHDEAARLGEQLTNTLETIPDAFCTLDAQWRFAYANREAERLFGTEREALIGAVVWEVFPEALGTAVEHHLRRAWETARTTAFEDYDRDGQRWFAFQVYPGEKELAVHLRDITERKRDQAQLEFLALYDPLTRLPNRRLLHDRVSTALANTGRSGHNGALLLFDIDDFKAINEAYGHPNGDALLRELAERVTQTLRRSDSVARLGSDEFAVLLYDLAGDAAAAEEQAARVCDKVMDAITQPYRLTECVYYATVSLGVTLLADRDDVDAVLKRADLAMNRAKEAGRNSRRFFEPAMEMAVSSRVQLETSLREAMTSDRVELHYQPQVDADGRVTGAEGLLRWHDPERGWIPPGEFIPIAEHTGLILDLGQKVFEMGCQRLARWAGDSDLAGLTLALNVSARQFHHRAFVDHVLEALQTAGAPAERLRLELTETVVLDSIEETTHKMVRLKAHGVGYALDDFGTGYSSLAYLKNLPLDRLKIDRTFVRDMAEDANDAALVRAVIAIARSLDLSVVAEGVETPEARALLEAAGCREHQGFLFGAAMPAEEFEAMARASMA